MKHKAVADVSFVVTGFLLTGCVLIGVIVLFFGSLFFAWGGCSCDREAPSDSDMTRYFVDNRAEFERLLDGHTEADLEKLGTSDATDWDSEHALFITWSRGWIGGSQEKGYLYSKEPPPSEKSRDDGSSAYEYHQYHHIEGDWLYLRIPRPVAEQSTQRALKRPLLPT